MSWFDIIKTPYNINNPNFPERESEYYPEGKVPKFDEQTQEVLFQGNQEGSSESEYWSIHPIEAMPYALFGNGQGNQLLKLTGKPFLNKTKETEKDIDMYYDFNESTAMSGKEHNRLGGKSKEAPIEYEKLPDAQFNKLYINFKSAILNSNRITTAYALNGLKDFDRGRIEEFRKQFSYAATTEEMASAMDNVESFRGSQNSYEEDVNLIIGNSSGLSIGNQTHLMLLLLHLIILEKRYNLG